MARENEPKDNVVVSYIMAELYTDVPRGEVWTLIDEPDDDEKVCQAISYLQKNVTESRIRRDGEYPWRECEHGVLGEA